MSSVSIVIPWRDLGCPFRRRNFDFMQAFWRRHLPDAEQVVSGGRDPFSRAQALNDAVRQAKGDLIFQCDPDSLAFPLSVLASLDLAREADGLVVCHTRYLYLNREATEEILAEGFDPTPSSSSWTEKNCEGNGAGAGLFGTNIACYSRATFEEAGGYEEKFGMWGGDDSCFALACGTLVGEQRRVEGDWLHLWHPRLAQSSPGGPGYSEQFAIIQAYHKAAEQGPEAMRALRRHFAG